MSAASLPYYWYLAWFSYPVANRAIYRELELGKIRQVLEIGLGNGERVQRMVEVLLRHHPMTDLRYYGVDLFEDRPAQDGLPLKTAHRTLRESGLTCRLVPGEPHNALSRVANEIRNLDLVIISADQDVDSLAKAWKYLPRMLSPQAVALRETADANGGTEFRAISLAELQSLAGQRSIPSTTARRAA